jgi:hypothetical protein
MRMANRSKTVSHMILCKVPRALPLSNSPQEYHPTEHPSECSVRNQDALGRDPTLGNVERDPGFPKCHVFYGFPEAL